ncbi:CaiB/BaiF CoA transferase family protein [Dankookia sp. GCM10030260]|uniref:CaiB/BaiF CoA transferase family protein n=1 Tax=Dankookia sp. GCM10030260 TaxID=3273390 RepID=UPI00361D441C
MTTQAGSGALHGLRVLDMSRVMAGPLAGQVLADLGADVIKVERPGRGDDTREWAPPFVADPPVTPLDESVYFWTCNRGKRSVVADIASPEGQALVARLVATSDVLIENYKVGTLAKYGLDYPTLSAANPRLVYCSITGFGQTGPYAPRPGYDTIVQGMGGLMSITGNPDDAPGGGPRKAGIAVADQMTALYADVAILAALRERERSGLGQHIDMSLLDVQVAGLTNLGMGYLATGRVPPRAGNRLATVYLSNSFRCTDGDLMIIVGNDAQFRAFCAALGMPEVSADVRFARNADRLRHADALALLIGHALRDQTLAECQALFDAAGVPASPINTLAQVFADPQVIARGLVREVVRPDGQAVRVIANPIRMSRTPPCSDRPPPRLGEHTEAVVAALPQGGLG